MSFTNTVITHKSSGAKAEVHPFGATVTSYQTAAGREILFVSRDAKLDGSKAIRGGIPLVFPQFGQPDKSMPQHGFLRNNEWQQVGEIYDHEDEAGASFELQLQNVKQSRGGKWDVGTTELDCTVRYTVKVAPSSLTTVLTIQNTGDKGFDFQTLCHTYYQVANSEALDGDKCHVVGLEGYTVTDKITGDAPHVLGSDPVVIDGIVDRVYSPPDGKNKVEVMVLTGASTSSKLAAFATVDGAEVPVSAVVWNPHKEKAEAMGDFGSDQYVDMICVEPGVLKDVPELQGGKECVFTQIITALE